MAPKNIKPAPARGTRAATSSRRQTLGLMLGAWASLPDALGAADSGAPLRLAISESLVADVNVNDARAAMLAWIKRMESDFDVKVDLDPRVFNPTEEILRRARSRPGAGSGTGSGE
jgi:hypothetical protein